MRIIAQRVKDLDLAEAWPVEDPLIAFVGAGRFHVFVTAFSEVPFADAARFAWPRAGKDATPKPDEPPFATGIVGLIAYDGAPHRAFRVQQSLVLDREKGVLWLGDDEGAGGLPSYQLTESATLEMIRRMQGLRAKPEATPSEAILARGFPMIPQESDATYLRRVAVALEEIRSGRYYQINLLRRFRLADPAPLRASLLTRLAHHGGPFAVVFDVPDLTLVSFSPERFVSVRPTADGLGATAEASPVKGTSARLENAAADRAAADALRANPKDLAELAMIVDLMRNDLGRVAVKGSVAVPEPLILTTHTNVHHLSARVTAALKPQTSVGDLVSALCPGGSITGAPKREVMRAIAAAEGVPRGYFMGNAFYADDRGAFDSSILIRTVVRRNQGPYEFAAGSGIVIKSDAEAEMEEIAAKARVVGPILAGHFAG